MNKKILVIGGTGFLGKNVVCHLVEKGYKVHLLHREGSNINGIPDTVEKFTGDVRDYDSLLKAGKGVDFVFHSAAMVKQWSKDRTIFEKINIEGFQNSMRAAKENKIPKIIYTSSFMALGPSNGEPINEDQLRIREHFHNDYERTKYLAEFKADEFIKQGYPIVKLYPGVIYGPGDITDGNIVIKNFLLPRLKKEFLGYFILGRGRGLWSYSYIDDVVNGHILALEKGKPGRGYILGGENTDHIRLYSLLEKYSGVKPPPLRMPFSMAKLKGLMDLAIANIFGKEPEVTPGAVSVFQKNWAYDSSRAVRELGYKMTPLEEGIKKTVEWLKKDGYYKE